MYKYVNAKIFIEGKETKIPIHITYPPTISDNELLIKAENVLHEAMNNATYHVVQNSPCGSCAFECDKEECENRIKDDFSCYIWAQ